MAVVTVHKSNPGAEFSAMITVINALAVLANELKTDYNAVLAKLDADAGVTDTNYVATRAIAAPDADTLVLGY